MFAFLFCFCWGRSNKKRYKSAWPWQYVSSLTPKTASRTQAWTSKSKGRNFASCWTSWATAPLSSPIPATWLRGRHSCTSNQAALVEWHGQFNQSHGEGATSLEWIDLFRSKSPSPLNRRACPTLACPTRAQKKFSKRRKLVPVPSTHQMWVQKSCG